MKAICQGFYATQVYLPCSRLSRHLRALSRKIRGKSSRFMQPTRLPQMSWRSLPCRGVARVWDGRKANGNVRLSELAILSALAAGVPRGHPIFEIGTFDGRTTLHLALSSHPESRIYTLDLPSDQEPAFPVATGERHMIEKPVSGQRYKSSHALYPEAVARIHQLLGDSATFDYTPYWETCGLVFVDGSHAYDYVISDSRTAMSLACSGGIVVWHDYGVWGGVTKALEELHERQQLGLRHIRGTSLVFWRKPVVA